MSMARTPCASHSPQVRACKLSHAADEWSDRAVLATPAHALSLRSFPLRKAEISIPNNNGLADHDVLGSLLVHGPKSWALQHRRTSSDTRERGISVTVWLCAGTTAGQDLNLSLERVLGNRNLTNKLWNAGKFLQMQLAGCSDSELADLAAVDFSTEHTLADLPLVERWILSSLHQV